jgi:transglutaminase-like putative cysteine protease
MYYAIRHVTRYRYSAPIAESHMELRMQPRSEGSQRCWDFQLRTTPRAKIDSYRDSLANTVHFFDVPARHTRLSITADARVEYTSPAPLPEALELDAWDRLDALAKEDDHWEMLAPSTFARPTELLLALQAELGFDRKDDPLTMLRNLNHEIYDIFSYKPSSTRVDSPIDEALQSRQGVCQDFAHIMTALVRGLGIPCRYVSGYLYHGATDVDRSTPGATHAWVEAMLPDLGWVGFDPTNDLVASNRHIRVAVGRDYDDVPPTRGVFTGDAKGEIAVDVKVELSAAPILEDAPLTNNWVGIEPEELLAIQQAQQQQQ